MNEALRFYPLLVVLVAVIAWRRSIRFHVFDLAALLPWCGALLTQEPLVPLLAFQVHALLYVTLWSRSAQSAQTEALSKFSLTLLCAVFLMTSAYLLFQSPLALWPLDPWLPTAGLWYEALGGALFAVAILLILGLPPLQQGWVDLAASWGAEQQLRMNLLLRLSLVFGLWSLLPSISQFLSPHLLELLASAGLLSLILSRLVVGVQMNVFRSFAYQASGSVFGFFIVLSAPELLRSSYHFDLIGPLATSISLLLLAFAYRPLLALPAQLRLQWDDPQQPAAARHRLRAVIGWDIVQALAGSCWAVFAGQYTLAVLSVVYLLCGLSLLQDRAAFQPRTS